jgi:hypothetical protein
MALCLSLKPGRDRLNLNRELNAIIFPLVQGIVLALVGGQGFEPRTPCL